MKNINKAIEELKTGMSGNAIDFTNNYYNSDSLRICDDITNYANNEKISDEISNEFYNVLKLALLEKIKNHDVVAMDAEILADLLNDVNGFYERDSFLDLDKMLNDFFKEFHAQTEDNPELKSLMQKGK